MRYVKKDWENKNAFEILKELFLHSLKSYNTLNRDAFAVHKMFVNLNYELICYKFFI